MALIQPVENGKIPETEKKQEKAAGNDLGYDQFLQLLCAEMQYQDPLQPTSNTEYVAQLATFSQMEATLNMQNTLLNNNANGLVGKYVIIKATSPTTGETSADAGFVDYVQYENNQQYVYVNGNRYSMNEVYQVMDPEYVDATTIASAFKDAVSKLPAAEELTMDDLQDVEDLCTVYNSLTSYQKAMIDKDTATKYKELVDRANELIINDFENRVEELPSPEELTIEQKETIAELQKTYKELTEYQLSKLDSETVKKYEALVEKMKELTGDAGSSNEEGSTGKEQK